MKTPTVRTKIITFRPDNDTFQAMARLRERQGVPYSEQIRRALREWLAERPDAWPLPGPAKRATARKRTTTTKGGRS